MAIISVKRAGFMEGNTLAVRKMECAGHFVWPGERFAILY